MLYAAPALRLTSHYIQQELGSTALERYTMVGYTLVYRVGTVPSSICRCEPRIVKCYGTEGENFCSFCGWLSNREARKNVVVHLNLIWFS